MTTHSTFTGDIINTEEIEPVSDSLRSILAESDTAQQQSLRQSVTVTLNTYFANLDGQQPFDVYQMVLSEVEAPLLEAVMQYTRNHQTKASLLLGINRGTLRKKLKQCGLL